MTLKQLIKRINESDEAESLAADWAIESADEAGYGVTEQNIEGHLECLEEMGADFDRFDALKIAVDKAALPVSDIWSDTMTAIKEHYS